MTHLVLSHPDIIKLTTVIAICGDKNSFKFGASATGVPDTGAVRISMMALMRSSVITSLSEVVPG